MVLAGIAPLAICVIGVAAQHLPVAARGHIVTASGQVRRFYNTTIESPSTSAEQASLSEMGTRTHGSSLTPVPTARKTTTPDHGAPDFESVGTEAKTVPPSTTGHHPKSIDSFSPFQTSETSFLTASVVEPISHILSESTLSGIGEYVSAGPKLAQSPHPYALTSGAVDISSALLHSSGQTDKVVGQPYAKQSNKFSHGDYLQSSRPQRETIPIQTSNQVVLVAAFPALDTKGWEGVSSRVLSTSASRSYAANPSLMPVEDITSGRVPSRVPQNLETTFSGAEISTTVRETKHETADTVGTYTVSAQGVSSTLDMNTAVDSHLKLSSTSRSSVAGGSVDAFSANDATPQSPKQRGTTAGIAVGVIGASALIGSCLLFISRRYRRRRTSHLRLPLDRPLSRQSSLEIRCVGKPG